MSAWYYQAEYAKQFLKFKVSQQDALKLFGIKQKDLAKISETDKQTYRRILAFD